MSANRAQYETVQSWEKILYLHLVYLTTVCAIIIVVIITWPEKFDFMLVPEHDVTGILI